MKLLNQIKIRYIKQTIMSDEYCIQRANDMNGQIQYWKRSKQHANTVTARNYCNMMINMYLIRYQYYIKK